MAERRTPRPVGKRKEARHTPRLDIVIPVFNEDSGLSAFHASLLAVLLDLPYACRVIYVDDGSTDRTAQVIAALPTGGLGLECVQLSRNFGHQAALTAGLDRAEAEAVITMDGDGEHPPTAIPEMLALHGAGCDIVLAVRRTSGEAPAFKRLTARPVLSGPESALRYRSHPWGSGFPSTLCQGCACPPVDGGLPPLLAAAWSPGSGSTPPFCTMTPAPGLQAVRSTPCARWRAWVWRLCSLSLWSRCTWDCWLECCFC